MATISLDRFYSTLADILQRERPDAFARPLTVAELYQDIVPYRRVRELLDLELHADYEHALLRLLAGEHERVRLEPESARDELSREIDAEDPNLSAYRRFAACEVFIGRPDGGRPGSGADARQPTAGAATPGVAERSAPAHEAGSAVATRSAVESGRSSTARPSRPSDVGAAADISVRAAAAPTARPAAHGAPRPAAVSACSFCGEGLPERPELRFCPYCGGDQRLHLCRACEQPLEPDWNFCVACGAAVAADG